MDESGFRGGVFEPENSVRPRKFFKTVTSTPTATKTLDSEHNIPTTDDVTKVIKLIANSPHEPLARSPLKSPIKTYVNKRKRCQSSGVDFIESFALPDQPIVPVTQLGAQFQPNKKIDIDVNINIDVNLPDPWRLSSLKLQDWIKEEPEDEIGSNQAPKPLITCTYGGPRSQRKAVNDLGAQHKFTGRSVPAPDPENKSFLRVPGTGRITKKTRKKRRKSLESSNIARQIESGLVKNLDQSAHTPGDDDAIFTHPTNRFKTLLINSLSKREPKLVINPLAISPKLKRTRKRKNYFSDESPRTLRSSIGNMIDIQLVDWTVKRRRSKKINIVQAETPSSDQIGSQQKLEEIENKVAELPITTTTHAQASLIAQAPSVTVKPPQFDQLSTVKSPPKPIDSLKSNDVKEIKSSRGRKSIKVPVGTSPALSTESESVKSDSVNEQTSSKSRRLTRSLQSSSPAPPVSLENDQGIKLSESVTTVSVETIKSPKPRKGALLTSSTPSTIDLQSPLHVTNVKFEAKLASETVESVTKNSVEDVKSPKPRRMAKTVQSATPAPSDNAVEAQPTETKSEPVKTKTAEQLISSKLSETDIMLKAKNLVEVLALFSDFTSTESESEPESIRAKSIGQRQSRRSRKSGLSISPTLFISTETESIQQVSTEEIKSSKSRKSRKSSQSISPAPSTGNLPLESDKVVSGLVKQEINMTADTGVASKSKLETSLKTIESELIKQDSADDLKEPKTGKSRKTSQRSYRGPSTLNLSRESRGLRKASQSPPSVPSKTVSPSECDVDVKSKTILSTVVGLKSDTVTTAEKLESPKLRRSRKSSQSPSLAPFIAETRKTKLATPVSVAGLKSVKSESIKQVSLDEIGPFKPRRSRKKSQSPSGVKELKPSKLGRPRKSSQSPSTINLPAESEETKFATLSSVSELKLAEVESVKQFSGEELKSPKSYKMRKTSQNVSTVDLSSETEITVKSKKMTTDSITSSESESESVELQSRKLSRSNQNALSTSHLITDSDVTKTKLVTLSPLTEFELPTTESVKKKSVEPPKSGRLSETTSSAPSTNHVSTDTDLAQTNLVTSPPLTELALPTSESVNTKSVELVESHKAHRRTRSSQSSSPALSTESHLTVKSHSKSVTKLTESQSVKSNSENDIGQTQSRRLTRLSQIASPALSSDVTSRKSRIKTKLVKTDSEEQLTRSSEEIKSSKQGKLETNLNAQLPTEQAPSVTQKLESQITISASETIESEPSQIDDANRLLPNKLESITLSLESVESPPVINELAESDVSLAWEETNDSDQPATMLETLSPKPSEAVMSKTASPLSDANIIQLSPMTNYEEQTDLQTKLDLVGLSKTSPTNSTLESSKTESTSPVPFVNDLPLKHRHKLATLLKIKKRDRKKATSSRPKSSKISKVKTLALERPRNSKKLLEEGVASDVPDVAQIAQVKLVKLKLSDITLYSKLNESGEPAESIEVEALEKEVTDDIVATGADKADTDNIITDDVKSTPFIQSEESLKKAKIKNDSTEISNDVISVNAVKVVTDNNVLEEPTKSKQNKLLKSIKEFDIKNDRKEKDTFSDDDKVVNDDTNSGPVKETDEILQSDGAKDKSNKQNICAFIILPDGSKKELAKEPNESNSDPKLIDGADEINFKITSPDGVKTQGTMVLETIIKTPDSVKKQLNKQLNQRPIKVDSAKIDLIEMRNLEADGADKQLSHTVDKTNKKTETAKKHLAEAVPLKSEMIEEKEVVVSLEGAKEHLSDALEPKITSSPKSVKKQFDKNDIKKQMLKVAQTTVKMTKSAKKQLAKVTNPGDVKKQLNKVTTVQVRSPDSTKKPVPEIVETIVKTPKNRKKQMENASESELKSPISSKTIVETTEGARKHMKKTTDSELISSNIAEKQLTEVSSPETKSSDDAKKQLNKIISASESTKKPTEKIIELKVKSPNNAKKHAFKSGKTPEGGKKQITKATDLKVISPDNTEKELNKVTRSKVKSLDNAKKQVFKSAEKPIDSDVIIIDSAEEELTKMSEVPEGAQREPLFEMATVNSPDDARNPLDNIIIVEVKSLAGVEDPFLNMASSSVISPPDGAKMMGTPTKVTDGAENALSTKSTTPDSAKKQNTTSPCNSSVKSVDGAKKQLDLLYPSIRPNVFKSRFTYEPLLTFQDVFLNTIKERDKDEEIDQADVMSQSESCLIETSPVIDVSKETKKVSRRGKSKAKKPVSKNDSCQVPEAPTVAKKVGKLLRDVVASVKTNVTLTDDGSKPEISQKTATAQSSTDISKPEITKEGGKSSLKKLKAKNSRSEVSKKITKQSKNDSSEAEATQKVNKLSQASNSAQLNPSKPEIEESLIASVSVAFVEGVTKPENTKNIKKSQLDVASTETSKQDTSKPEIAESLELSVALTEISSLEPLKKMPQDVTPLQAKLRSKSDISKSEFVTTIENLKSTQTEVTLTSDSLKVRRGRLTERLPIDVSSSSSTPNRGRVRSKSENFRSDISKKYYEFKVGDLAWGKIGSYPYWPCLITNDPEKKTHRRVFLNKSYPAFHVRFFADNGRRAWITAQYLIQYTSKEDLESIGAKLRAEGKLSVTYLNECYCIKPKAQHRWRHAVQEAELSKEKTSKERIKFFNDLLEDKVEKSPLPIKERRLKRERQNEGEPSEIKRKKPMLDRDMGDGAKTDDETGKTGSKPDPKQKSLSEGKVVKKTDDKPRKTDDGAGKTSLAVDARKESQFEAKILPNIDVEPGKTDDKAGKTDRKTSAKADFRKKDQSEGKTELTTDQKAGKTDAKAGETNLKIDSEVHTREKIRTGEESGRKLKDKTGKIDGKNKKGRDVTDSRSTYAGIKTVDMLDSDSKEKVRILTVEKTDKTDHKTDSEDGVKIIDNTYSKTGIETGDGKEILVSKSIEAGKTDQKTGRTDFNVVGYKVNDKATAKEGKISDRINDKPGESGCEVNTKSKDNIDDKIDGKSSKTVVKTDEKLVDSGKEKMSSKTDLKAGKTDLKADGTDMKVGSSKSHYKTSDKSSKITDKTDAKMGSACFVIINDKTVERTMRKSSEGTIKIGSNTNSGNKTNMNAADKTDGKSYENVFETSFSTNIRTYSRKDKNSSGKIGDKPKKTNTTTEDRVTVPLGSTVSDKDDLKTASNIKFNVSGKTDDKPGKPSLKTGSLYHPVVSDKTGSKTVDRAGKTGFKTTVHRETSVGSKTEVKSSGKTDDKLGKTDRRPILDSEIKTGSKTAGTTDDKAGKTDLKTGSTSSIKPVIKLDMKSGSKPGKTGKSSDKTDLLSSTHKSITKSTVSALEGISSHKHKSRLPECSSSDTDSKFSDNSSVPASLESQAALFRRNNIFKGISREKVCQICEKPGETLKCRGPCNGVYHYACAKPNFLMTLDIIEEQDQKPMNKVEIVSVATRRGEPAIVEISDLSEPSGLTLSEKIDLTMEELMRKLEQNPYGDSESDTSEEEEVIVESELAAIDVNRKKQQNKLINREVNIKNKEPNKNIVIKHVTADTINYIYSDNEGKECNNDKEFKCYICAQTAAPSCLVCSHTDVGRMRQKCSLFQCGRYYHRECLKSWPQTQWSIINTGNNKMPTFVCPRHVCHTCVSENPSNANSRCPSDKLVKCLRCPATYHCRTDCVPAGSQILSASQMVCPRHGQEKPKAKARKSHQLGNLTINANWCFICAKGGALVCCETCPTSVHLECFPGDFNPEDRFFCEDCQSGRLPLYDEIVWVKLGAFRWWPALILYPNEVPENVRTINHRPGEFVVKFFGTYDHYWVGRGRTFLFQEGDKGHSNAVKKKVDANFLKAIDEAAAAHTLKKQFKTSRVNEKSTGLKPPPYIRIKTNKPVGNVRLYDGNISNTTSCDCDPNQPHPCGPDSDCLNRLLLTECNPELCPAGDRCNNLCFEKREYPPMIPFHTQSRGWGLRNLAPIRQGQFVVEYVGEMIDEREYQRRIKKMHEQKEENYYFLTIDNQRMLDAGPKGNVARFMNHSCQPNCETQKWTVNGDTRVGLFAKCDIPTNTELTFNYNLECIGKEMKICKCGAPNCSGFIGVKAKNEESQRKRKRASSKVRSKKSKAAEVISEPEPDTNVCFVCGVAGNVGACNNKLCTRFYHLQCINLEAWPEGNKWVCPGHNCNFCSKRTIRCCIYCLNSYCPPHAEGNVRYEKTLGFVCSQHDPDRVAAKEAESLDAPLTSSTPMKPTLTSSSPLDSVDENVASNITEIDQRTDKVKTCSSDLLSKFSNTSGSTSINTNDRDGDNNCNVNIDEAINTAITYNSNLLEDLTTATQKRLLRSAGLNLIEPLLELTTIKRFRKKNVKQIDNS